jgi:Transglutaminase-like superfamily
LAAYRSLAISAVAAALVLSDTHAAFSTTEAPPIRWTDETPDAMVEDAVARATAPNAAPRAKLAALATVASLSDRAAWGVARKAAERIGATGDADVRGEAALMVRSLSGDEGSEVAAREDAKLGVVDAVALLGPFRDTGGGLDAHDGPEATAGAFADGKARYSWGSYEVAWRAVPRSFAGADGVPLDVFVFPRKESCTWVATKLTVTAPQKLLVRLAATGQARLVFDGTDVARDDAVHENARFDRLAAQVQASPGAHLLAAKVCAGALDDDGRVRLRVTDAGGAWPAGLSASPDLDGTPRPSTGRRPLLRVAFERISTPLERALAGAATDVEARTQVAVLRTLGGADDLRSPRAPGILAALADGSIDADHLAMAAWVAPSGANRSGWLNRAREGASADPRTRAFVERRLVERHVEAGLADWAMLALRGAKIDVAGDAEAALLASQVDVALGTDALRLRAIARLASIAAKDATAPTSVLETLADLLAPFNPRQAAEQREVLASRGELGSPRVVAMQTEGHNAVIPAARRAFAGGVDDSDEAVAVAQAVARTGAHDEARGLFEQLARWAPNRATVWAGLAEETAAGPADSLRDEAATAELRRARELDPGEVRYRAELALRTRTPNANDEPHDDEKYLTSSQTILARRLVAAPAPAPVVHAGPVASDPVAKSSPPVAASPAQTDAPDVADRELHWLRAVVMHPDRRVSELVHYAREIVIPPRTDDELYEDVPAEGDVTEIVRARVHRKDGSTAFPLEEANDDARPRIRWPELDAGDVVEVAFRSWTAGPVGGRGDPPFFRLDYAGGQSTHPVVYNEVVVESPRDRPIYVDVVNGKADRRDEKDTGPTHVVRLVWDKPVNVPDEPLAPPLSEIIPTLVLSTFKDWNAFRSWYGEAVRGFTEPDAQVRELAAKLTAGKTTREAKLRALFDFVADDIRYVNYVSGEWWLPNRPQQLLARREGDCDDKALLLITLLKAVGIDAQEVMVQTRLTGQPSVLRARGAAVPLFDHGIAFLPGPGGGTYLDATSPQSRLGPLPSMDARAVALRLDGPAEIVDLPSSSPDDHGVDATWTIGLKPDGSADLEGEERATGDDAFWMRTYLTEPGPRAQWVEEHLVGPWFPTVEVDKKVDFQGDLARGGATTRWRARSSGLARHEGQELVVPLSPSQTTASQLAPLVNRTLPVWLPPYVAPRKESRTIRVVAPAGYAFEPLPPGGDENGGAFGHAHLDLARDPRDPRTVIVRRTIAFDRSEIAVEDYPKWRAWVQRVDALMHRSVRLVPAAPIARGTP